MKETGGPEQAQMHHCGHMFFRMRLGNHFLQKLMTLGLHWGPFGRPRGSFFCNFCNVLLGSDFRLILDMLLVGAGGRGVAAERCRFCRLAKKFALHLSRASPFGGAANLQAAASAADPFILDLLMNGCLRSECLAGMDRLASALCSARCSASESSRLRPG